MEIVLKKGDKLICIDSQTYGLHLKLNLMGIYTFESYHISHPEIYLKEIPNLSWFEYRFKKIGPVLEYILKDKK